MSEEKAKELNLKPLEELLAIDASQDAMVILSSNSNQ